MAQVCYKLIGADAALAVICLVLAILLLLMMAELLPILVYSLAALVAWQ
jgi:hypothetical protein